MATLAMSELLGVTMRRPARTQLLPEALLSDGGSDDALARLTRVACRTLRVPAAFIAFAGKDFQYFASHEALPAPFAAGMQTPVTAAFCQSVVLAGEPLVVADVKRWPSLGDDPAMAALGAAACLGVPLTGGDGAVLGSLCAVDHAARPWSGGEVELLGDLAAVAMAAVELRLQVHEARALERTRTALLESTGEGIYSVDTAGRCTFLNRAGSELLGFGPAEVLGASIHRLIHHSRPDGTPYPETSCPILRAFREGVGVRGGDEVFWRKDGTSLRVEYSSFPVYEHGDISGAVVTFTDVTERRRLEEEAQRTSKQLQAVLAQIAEGVIFTDADGRIVFVNEAARQIHGVAELGVPVERYSEAYALFTAEGEPHPPYDLPLARAVRDGETVHAACWRIRRPDGAEVLAEGSATPVWWPDGGRLGAVLTIRDVTEPDRARRERERLLRREQEARERIAGVFESITDAFFALDSGWRFTYVNRQAERVLQRPRSELLGRCIWEEFPDAAAAFRRNYERALEEQRTVEFEALYAPLGAWFEVRAYPSAEGLSVYFRDVTDRRRSEEERLLLLERERAARAEAERRAREEAALRRAAEAIGGVFSIDAVIGEIVRGVMQAVEADAVLVERIHGREDQIELVPMAGANALPGGTRIGYAESFASRVISCGEPVLVAPLGTASGGTAHRLAQAWPDGSALVVPLRDEGEAIGSLVLVRSAERAAFDLDEIGRARTFADLAALAFRKVHLLRDSEHKREELQQLMESRSRLMRGFTHDVKNPLGAADGHLQILGLGLKGELTTDQLQSIERARASLQGALALIDDLIELARAESGHLEVEWRPLDIREAARELAEDYRAPAEAKQLRMRVEIPDEVPLVVSDSARIRQILGNLLSNAVKYTDRGELVVVVATREAGGSRWVTIGVRDTGVGIPEEQLSGLFREFSRPAAGDRHGAGLGLAISQRVARALAGRITVESVPGSGSTFTLWLPLT
jgi:PAS domain S-box-containing protein